MCLYHVLYCIHSTRVMCLYHVLYCIHSTREMCLYHVLYCTHSIRTMYTFVNILFKIRLGNPRWLPPQVIVLTQDHMHDMGKYRKIFFSEAIALIEPKLCINHWKVLFKLCVFYVDRNSKMTTTAGQSFYMGSIGSFYNQVNDKGS